MIRQALSTLIVLQRYRSSNDSMLQIIQMLFSRLPLPVSTIFDMSLQTELVAYHVSTFVALVLMPMFEL
jgi:hypothetical protein